MRLNSYVLENVHVAVSNAPSPKTVEASWSFDHGSTAILDDVDGAHRGLPDRGGHRSEAVTGTDRAARETRWSGNQTKRLSSASRFVLALRLRSFGFSPSIGRTAVRVRTSRGLSDVTDFGDG